MVIPDSHLANSGNGEQADVRPAPAPSVTMRLETRRQQAAEGRYPRKRNIIHISPDTYEPRHSIAARRKAQRIRAAAAGSVDHFALAWHFGKSILEMPRMCGNCVRACGNCGCSREILK
jgi:hypothetical protein